MTILGHYYDVNVHGTQVLLEAMVRAGIGLILFSSSCAIYGEPADMPIEESTTVNQSIHMVSLNTSASRKWMTSGVLIR